MSRDFKSERELNFKAREAEKEFFKNLNIEENLKLFPLRSDVYENDKKQIQEASNFITDIVYYILKNEGAIITLGKREYDDKKFLETNKDAKRSKRLQESLKQEKNGKKIMRYLYYKEYYNTKEYIEYADDGDYKINNDFENNNEKKLDNILDPRVEDAINQLIDILFIKDAKIENFYEEYGEVSEFPKEFIAFIKKMLREDVYVCRYFQGNIVPSSKKKLQRYNMPIDKEKSRLDVLIEEEDKDKYEVYNKMLDFLKQNSETINNFILKEMNDVYKKELTIFYYDYKSYIESDMNLQPKSMKALRLLSKYYEKSIVDIRKKEFQHLPPLEKKKQIQDILDPMNFWDQFFNINKDYINNFEYKKERKDLEKNKNISREQEKIIRQVNSIIWNYLKKENNQLENKDTKEKILSIVRRMFLKTGGNVTKQEIVVFSKELMEQNSCLKYKENILLDLVGLLNDKEKSVLSEHLNNCKDCKCYKDKVSKGITHRENRNKNILSEIKQNPYLETDVKTEEEYNNIKNEEYCYGELKKTKSPMFLNYYILALIKNGKKKDAKEIMNNPKKFINENLML